MIKKSKQGQVEPLLAGMYYDFTILPLERIAKSLFLELVSPLMPVFDPPVSIRNLEINS
jgi:hypothetical protein